MEEVFNRARRIRHSIKAVRPWDNCETDIEPKRYNKRKKKEQQKIQICLHCKYEQCKTGTCPIFKN